MRAARGGRDAGRHLVHGRDRRPAAERPAAGRGDRADRRGDRRLRPPTSWSTAPTRRTSPTCWRTAERGRERIRGLRANASTLSHAELDEAEELDDGDPAELGAPVRRAAASAPAAERARRLLRHRPPPRGGDQPGPGPGDPEARPAGGAQPRSRRRPSPRRRWRRGPNSRSVPRTSGGCCGRGPVATAVLTAFELDRARKAPALLTGKCRRGAGRRSTPRASRARARA